MEQVDFKILHQAVQTLESSRLATKISHLIGIPIEKTLAALPGHWSTIVTRITNNALEKAMDGALLTLSAKSRKPANKTHKLMAGISGALGGAFGIAALAVELPVSATIMLRSIAEIARSEGENLDDFATKAACLEVFAFSGGSAAKESADTSYYAIRSLMAKAMGDSTKHIAAKGLTKESAPILVKLVNAVAGRFSVPVSEKLAAQSIPVVGALGGATINMIFIDHFQDMAKAHFAIRKLERKYGEEVVKQVYSEIMLKKNKVGMQHTLKVRRQFSGS